MERPVRGPYPVPPHIRYDRRVPKPTIADTAAELLTGALILTPEEIGRVLVARGRTRNPHPARAATSALRGDRRFGRLDDGSWTLIERMLEGVVLTHEVTEQEAAAGAVAFDPDLSPFFEPLTRPSAGREPPLWLAFGAQAATLLGQPHTRVLTGPAGWLPGGPGTLIHARLLGGQFTVAAGPRPAPESTTAERRRAE